MENIRILENNNSYLGFEYDKPSIQKYRIKNILDKIFRYNNLSDDLKSLRMTRKDFVLYLTLNDYIPIYKKDLCKCIKNEYKYINIYTMCSNKDNSYWRITKTEYDFANYLLNKGLTSKEKIISFIDLEKKQILEELIKKEEIQKIKQAEKEKIESFDKWILEQLKNYSDKKKINLQKVIFLDLNGRCNLSMRKLLVLIDNIDNPIAKLKLIDMLHNSNIASRKTFEYITGLNLPKTKKEMLLFFERITSDDFKETREYKPRKMLVDKNKKVFYINIDGNFYEALGEPFNICGLDLFITNYSKNEYEINEVKTGVKISQGFTKDEAICNFNNCIKNMGIKELNNRINELIDKYGMSPYYTEKDFKFNC